MQVSASVSTNRPDLGWCQTIDSRPSTPSAPAPAAAVRRGSVMPAGPSSLPEPSASAPSYVQTRVSRRVRLNLNVAESPAPGEAEPSVAAPTNTGGHAIVIHPEYDGGYDEMTDDGRIRHKSITPMHQNAGTGTWVLRGSSWEDAHSEENTKRELLIDRPPKQFERHFHPRAEHWRAGGSGARTASAAGR